MMNTTSATGNLKTAKMLTLTFLAECAAARDAMLLCICSRNFKGGAMCACLSVVYHYSIFHTDDASHSVEISGILCFTV